MSTAVDAPRTREELVGVTHRARVSGNGGALDAAALHMFERSNLTRTQLTFYLGQKLHPNVPLYAAAGNLFIPAAVDRDRFNQAFQRLVDHSDAMRTVIETIDGVPQQRVLPELPYVPEFVDLSADPDPRAAAEAWGNERTQTMHILAECLFDSALLKLGETHYCWYINKHHIITDAYSFVLMVKHMGHLYDCALAGSLDEALPPRSFHDFAEAECRGRNNGGNPDERAYWRGELDRQTAPLSMYGKTITRQIGRISKRPHNLGHDCTRRARALVAHDPLAAHAAGAAEFNLVAAVLLTYLHKVSGARRVSIGMPIHNRRSPEHRQIIGILIGVLPLTIDVEDTDTLRTLIDKVAQQAADRLQNRSYYFRHVTHTHTQDVLLNYLTQSCLQSVPGFAGTDCEPQWINAGYGIEPLTISFYDCPVSGNVELIFDFNETSFCEHTQDVVLRHFAETFDAVVADPDAPLAAFSLVGEDEQHRLLHEFNAALQAPIADTTVHALVEATVETAPDVAAVAMGSTTLSYTELNRRANQLAHYLRRQRVGPDDLIGLCADRSVEMAIGVLGILKSGAAYLPLDPQYPKERLAFMVRDAHVPIVLTQQALLGDLPPGTSRVICLDSDWPAIADECADNPVPTNAPDDLAYVIYTSGSTGQPKGVAMPHRALVNLVQWQQTQSASTAGTKTLQFAPLSFDVSFQEMFCTWATGGTLVLVDNQTRRDSRALLATIVEQGIERLFLPFIALQALARTANDTNVFPGCLREVITAGEQLRITDPVRAFFSRMPSCALVNQYGPTESHVVTAYTLEGAPADWPALPPIGRPIANTSLYVLDDARQLLPVGVPGELYIAGAGLAHGYLGRPDITGERFVTNPFGRGEDDRMYRTGDIARFRPDGNIEFLGRADHQVKVRGYRIELGEVESAIMRHASVAETVVVARRDAREEQQIIAYVVLREESGGLTAELKAHVKRTLPDYMLPSAFVVLDALPLGPTGKVDRAALPAPDRTDYDVRGQMVGPRDTLELGLLQIWEQIFDIRTFGVTDSFFDLGGHSLSAVYLMDQIQVRFGKTLSPSVLFEAPTIEALADAVRRHDGDMREPALVPIQPRGTKTPFFCVHPAPGTVFCYVALAKHLGEDRPFWGIQAPSVNGANYYFSTIEESAAYYVEALKRVRPNGPYLLGGHSSGGPVSLEMARLLRAEGHNVRVVALLDSFAPALGGRAARLIAACQQEADDAFWLACMVMLVEFFFDTKLDAGYKDLRRLPIEDQYNVVRAELQRVNFLPPHAGPGAMHGLVENLRTVIAAAILYGPGPYDGKIAFLKAPGLFTAMPTGARSHNVTMLFRALRRDWQSVLRGLPCFALDFIKMTRRSGVLRRLFGEPTLGWRRMSTQPVEVIDVTGNHVTMLSEPHVQTLAAKLRAVLDAADGPN